jgi:hypothetical protein
MDYGSADITDHTFVTDGTGDGEVVLPDDSIGDAEIAFDEVTGADLTLTDATTITASGKITANASLDVKNGATTSGVLAIFEDSDDGTNKATFQVPALTADTVYTLPPDDGDSGEQLQTNGSGTLTWEAAGSGTDTLADEEYQWDGVQLLPLEHGADSIPPPVKEAGTNVDTLTANFQDTTDECRSGTFSVHGKVNTSGTATIHYYWYADTSPAACGSACEVMWDFRHAPIDHDESWDTALTTVAADASTTPATDKDLVEITDTLSVSTAGWVADDVVYFEVCRDANHASDDLSGDANLVKFKIDLPLTP